MLYPEHLLAYWKNMPASIKQELNPERGTFLG